MSERLTEAEWSWGPRTGTPNSDPFRLSGEREHRPAVDTPDSTASEPLTEAEVLARVIAGRLGDVPMPSEVAAARTILASDWLAAREAAAATRARAEGAEQALREAAHWYGVIWGSGETTEAKVADVLNEWAEHGIGRQVAP